MGVPDSDPRLAWELRRLLAQLLLGVEPLGVGPLGVEPLEEQKAAVREVVRPLAVVREVVRASEGPEDGEAWDDPTVAGESVDAIVS